jgi:hypothetical protein
MQDNAETARVSRSKKTRGDMSTVVPWTLECRKRTDYDAPIQLMLGKKLTTI